MSFIYAISPIQCKVARTHLEWTQKALAGFAKVGRSTVRKFEDKDSVRRESVLKIRKAFELYGIEFTEGDGVKRRGNVVKMLQGSDSYEKFYDDLVHTAKDHGSDILCVAMSQALFLRACGIRDSGDFKRLEFLGKLAKIKCLITDSSMPVLDIPHVEF